MSKILVVYFSRTGFTEQVAEHVADHCGADIDAVREPRSRLGLRGYLRSAREALGRRPAEIAPMLHDPADYELVIFGTPVWAGHVASPMRTCLAAHRTALRRVAFICTQGGSGAGKVLQEMAAICGRQPEATLVVNDREIQQRSYRPKLERFTDALGLPPPD